MEISLPHRALVAPIGHSPFRVEDGPSGRCLMTDGEPAESYPVFLGVPILIPPGLVADWDHNVLEIVLGKGARAISDDAHRRHGASEAAVRAVAAWIRDNMGAAGVRETFREYGQRDPAARLRWRETGAGPDGRSTGAVTEDELRRGRRNASRDWAVKLIAQARNGADTWGYHLPHFRHLLAAAEARTAIELGCGACCGTTWILDSVGPETDLFAVDVDFCCAANCLGIRHALDRVERLHPVVGSFWFLPFADASVDLVCSHYGIDETREVIAALREVSRVLRPGGTMISVSRTDPTLRLKTHLGELGMDDEELAAMAREVDLYAGPDDLVARAEKCGLRAEGVDRMHAEGSHDRTVFQFRKVLGEED